MDEQNLDREQMADMYADTATNKMNTYNLNTLFPYFDIMPGTGGNIEITDTKAFDPVQPEDHIREVKTCKDQNYDGKRGVQILMEKYLLVFIIHR